MKILDFWSPTCGPCRALSPILERLQNESDLLVEKINVDDNLDSAVKYHVYSIPTLLKVDESGNEISRLVGLRTYENLVEWIKE